MVGSLMVTVAPAQVIEKPAGSTDTEESRTSPSGPDAPPPQVASPAQPIAPSAAEAADNEVDQEEPRNKVVTPVTPPPPARAGAAILRVLDKVTTETMAFEAPIGRRVRYKSLVFEVKTCVCLLYTSPSPRD